MDVYAAGTIATGSGGNIPAYMNSSGQIYASGNITVGGNVNTAGETYTGGYKMNNKIVTNYLKEGKITDIETFIEENEISADDYFNIFLYFKNRREFEISKKYLIKAVELAPDNLQYKLILSTICLAINDFKNGWKYYEERLLLPSYNNENILPRWNGTDKYKSIVVLVEQGYGDSFMFARFMYLLKNHFDYVSFCVSPELFNIFTPQNLGIDEVSNQYVRNNFDCFCYLSSLPHLLEINNEILLSNNNDYLKEKIQQNNLNNKKLNIGFCLNGRTTTDYEKTRSVDIKTLTDLFENKNIEMHSLYKPEYDSYYENLVQKNKITEHSQIFKDFNKTAQIINSMDLIITSDTAILHLAGTLGKKTFLLLPKLTDWRWKTEGYKTYWYKSVEIFRQKEQGVWKHPVDKLTQHIKEKYVQKNIWEKIKEKYKK